MRRWPLVALALVLACALVAGAVVVVRTWTADPTGAARPLPRASSAPPDVPPQPGAAGVGDEYFPLLGNGGYDVRHYTLRVRYDPSTYVLVGRVTIDATATHALSQFNLDFSELKITALRVGGVDATTDATWRLDGDHELVVTPAAPLRSGQEFRVEVQYEGRPDGEAVPTTRRTAHWWPANRRAPRTGTRPTSTQATRPPRLRDHRPEGLTAIANGVPRGSEPAEAGWRTWRWAATTPMASYLSTMAIGHFRIFEGTMAATRVFGCRRAGGRRWRRRPGDATHGGGHRVPRHAVRPVPVRSAGGDRDDQRLGFALETQTRPVYSRLLHRDRATVSPTRWRTSGSATASRSTLARHLAQRGLRHLRPVALGGARRRQRGAGRLRRVLPGADQRQLWRPAPGNPGEKGLFSGRGLRARGA